jgi:hypothetical protein
MLVAFVVYSYLESVLLLKVGRGRKHMDVPLMAGRGQTRDRVDLKIDK